MHYDQLRILMTDSKCNLNCAYCIAGYKDNAPKKSTEVNESKLYELVRLHDFSSISIWGGEPFFNFSKLKVVVGFCKEHFPKLPIMIISNGTAFSKEKISFINKHNIRITLSHDAYCQHYRGIDFLKNKNSLELIRNLDNVGFTSVIHKYNLDFKQIFKYFEEIRELLNRDFYWGFELLQLAGPASLKFLLGDDEIKEFSLSLDFLLNQFVKGHNFAHTSLHNTLLKMATIIDKNLAPDCRCGADRRLTVTSDGQVAFCQVRAERGLFDVPVMEMPQMCNLCNVSRFCRGYCPGMTIEAREKMCPLYKIFYTKLYSFLVNLKAATN